MSNDCDMFLAPSTLVRAKRGRDLEIPALEPPKPEKMEKPEFRVQTPESRERREKRKNLKDRTSRSGPLKLENTEKTENAALRKTQSKRGKWTPE